MALFDIFAGGNLLEGWTSATLERSKDQMTGSLNLNVFFSSVPASPIFTELFAGAEILVYIDSEIAFTGIIDRRTGTGDKRGNEGTKDAEPSGVERNVTIGPNDYNISIVARGKTKRLVDTSHNHPTTNMLKPTNKDAVEALLEGTEVELDWMAQETEIDKIRFRDGSRVIDELQKIGQANCHYMYETRDGKLRVTDDTARQIGDSLILGENIISFSAQQSEDQGRSEIRVKGQRTPKEVWGKKAVEEIEKVIQDGSSTNKAVVTVQHYGDATGEALERRANFEASNRNSASKQITIEVFSVVGQTAPYDVGLLHYVEIPTEGIFDVFECVGLTYSVQATDELKTTLTLSPPPSSGVSGGATGGALGVPSASTNIPIPSPAPRS